METSPAHQRTRRLGAQTTVHLGGQLRRARRAAGLDQQTLADLVDVHRSYMVTLENGVGTLALHRLVAALDLVGMELAVVRKGRRAAAEAL